MDIGIRRVIATRSLWLAFAAALSLAALAGCAASPADSASAPAATTPAVPGTAAGNAATPPPRAPASASRADAVPRIDASCRVDADCAVKDVGNCCGAYPACVNKDSPTDPAAVQAACQASGRMSTCGFRQIASCSCDAGTCRAQGEPVGGWTEGPQPAPVR